MSINKFSKDVLLVLPDWESYRQSDNSVQQDALLMIENVIKRLHKLEFPTIKVVGDNSLSRETLSILKRFNFDVKVLDVHPNASRNLIYTHILGDDRISYLEDWETYKPTLTEKELSDLLNLEISISGRFNSDEKIDVKADMPIEAKVKIISRVIARTKLNIPVDNTVLTSKKSEVGTLLRMSNITQEELEKFIMDDIESKWEWATNLIYNPASVAEFLEEERLDNLESGKASYEMTQDDLNLLETLGLLSSQESEELDKYKVESKISIDFKKSTAENLMKKSNEEVEAKGEEDADSMKLINALTELNRMEFSSSGILMEKLQELLKDIDSYSTIVLKNEMKNSMLIFDFSMSSTSTSAKCIPYSSGENRIIIKVDVRNGYVEPFFKGQSFRLNPFFTEGEEVKTNVKQW